MHLIEFRVANQISVKRFVSTIFIAFVAAHKSLADNTFALCACESVTRVRGQLIRFTEVQNEIPEKFIRVQGLLGLFRVRPASPCGRIAANNACGEGLAARLAKYRLSNDSRTYRQEV